MSLPASTSPARSGIRLKLPVLLAALVLFTVLPPAPVRSQSFVSNAPDTQRNAMNAVRTQAGYLQNATRVALSYGDNAVQTLSDQFQALCRQYNSFTATLTPPQQAGFANEWSELSVGLDIIQEAFANYQQDLANGRSRPAALSDLRRVLSEATRMWLREFNATVSQARVGW
jgi:hypothetical protein